MPVIHSRFPQKASGGARCSPREGAPEPHRGWRGGQTQASAGAEGRVGRDPWLQAPLLTGSSERGTGQGTKGCFPPPGRPAIHVGEA